MEKCKWIKPIDSNQWILECGRVHKVTKMSAFYKYCPFCGKEIAKPMTQSEILEIAEDSE